MPPGIIARLPTSFTAALPTQDPQAAAMALQAKEAPREFAIYCQAEGSKEVGAPGVGACATALRPRVRLMPRHGHMCGLA